MDEVVEVVEQFPSLKLEISLEEHLPSCVPRITHLSSQ